jgi:hypothetical protein
VAAVVVSPYSGKTIIEFGGTYLSRLECIGYNITARITLGNSFSNASRFAFNISNGELVSGVAPFVDGLCTTKYS